MTTVATTTASSGRHAAPAPSETPSAGATSYPRHVIALAKRSLIKMWRTPEALIDVTLQPIIFLLMFTYIFGGAIAGSSSDYLQFLLPGLLGQTIAMAGVALGQNLNADIEKGVFDRFRSLPIGRSVPLVGAVFADIARYFILCVVTLGFGMIMGFRIETNPMAALAAVGISIAFALCFCWISVFVGMDQGIVFRWCSSLAGDEGISILARSRSIMDLLDLGVRHQDSCRPDHAEARSRASDLAAGDHCPSPAWSAASADREMWTLVWIASW